MKNKTLLTFIKCSEQLSWAMGEDNGFLWFSKGCFFFLGPTTFFPKTNYFLGQAEEI